MVKKPNYDRPLPQCEGPKLAPFRHRNSKVEFVRLLSDTSRDDESGGHAHVFEVSMAEETYALKIFKFFDDEEVRAGLAYARADTLIPIDLLNSHADPFYSECRAFGRIIEAGHNGKIAVRCHGHMTLPAEIEVDLYRKFGVTWDRFDDDRTLPVSKKQPLRAIVKDLLVDDTPITQKAMNKMLRDLKKMRALGIYPMDIYRRNYRAGLLLDMSIALTEPHYLFDIRTRRRINDMKREDLVNMEALANEEGLICRAVRNKEYCAKLRPLSGKISYK